MKKLITFLLGIVVFVVTLMCMVQPAYTDTSIIPAANASGWDVPPTVQTHDEPATLPKYPEPALNVPAHEHHFVEVTQKATCTDDGYIKSVCECGEENNETLKAIGHQYSSVTHAPTCTTDGYTIYTCESCGHMYKDDITDATNHAYGDWKIVKNATPDNHGSQSRACMVCGKKQTETITFTFASKNAVYIPSANIHAKFVTSDFNQSAVDGYDVVYSWVPYADEPFILGHNTGSMKKLYNTQIGDIIYVNLNGQLIRYKVVVSEHGMQDAAKSNIIGQSTGVSIWDSYDAETLHMYTCYGANKDSRWIVLAIRIN